MLDKSSTITDIGIKQESKPFDWSTVMTERKTVRLVVEGVPIEQERMLRVKAANNGHNSLAAYLREQFSKEYDNWKKARSNSVRIP